MYTVASPRHGSRRGSRGSWLQWRHRWFKTKDDAGGGL